MTLKNDPPILVDPGQFEIEPMLVVPTWMRGLIFDCDGTLVDTLPLHYAAWEKTFAALGLVCPLEFLMRHNGKPTDWIVARYNVEFGHAIDVARFTADKERRTYALLDQARPLEPVATLARRYHGRLPMAVVSGSNRPNVERALGAARLRALFPVVLTADDGLPPKPAPDLFLEAARRLEVEPVLCQAFEDADAGLEAARHAGMLATDVRPFGGGYPSWAAAR
ncbi:MAG: HAD family phosphatase [Candidatus Contendobacter sp.]|nr:HAD family phosphatase [Candidatus Contendobacter sp.]